ncbi:MAG: hypothetical protein IT289_05560 [Oligoflexia bacterium]|nr:hypothetical protein [Oligoflexia bacterium]
MIINGQGRGCINLANGQFHFLAGMGAGISFGASAHATVLIFRGDDSEGISGTYCGGRVDFAEAQYGANLNIYKRVKGKSGFLYGIGWSGGASTSLSVDCININ